MPVPRGDDFLPTHHTDNYSKTWKPPKGNVLGRSWQRLKGSPVLRLLVLILAIAGLAYTFHSKRSAALEQEPALVDDEDSRQAVQAPDQREQQQQQQHEWAGRKVSNLDRDQARRYLKGSAASVRRLPFNQLLHRMYKELPPLREATPAIVTGSWQLNKAVYDYAATNPAAEVLSWDKPRVVLFRSFLSPEETQHLIDVSAAHMHRSEVLRTVGPDGSTVNDARTSYGAWAPLDEVVKRITARIHRVSAVPEQFGEGLYILRYQEMQQYLGHNDHCMSTGKGVAEPPCADFLQRAGGPDCGPGKGGPTCGDRIVTFILSLRHPTRGGATVFPEAAITKQRLAAAGKQPSSGHDWYCKEPEVLGVNLSAGDALMFWDYAPGRGKGTGSYRNGTADPQAQAIHEALHSGCPVLEGEKWIATRWMRSTGFDYPLLMKQGKQ